MKISKSISQAIKRQQSNLEIEEIAVNEGMLTLKDYGIQLIKDKYTTVSEMRKICND